VEKNIILEGPRKGRCHTYRLNYAVGYKGDEGRQTKGGFRVPRRGKKKDGSPAFPRRGRKRVRHSARAKPKDAKPPAPDSKPDCSHVGCTPRTFSNAEL